MDTRLQALAGKQHGTFTAGEAKALGVGDHLLRRAVAGGHLVRVRREAYGDMRLWKDADAEGRYRLKVIAVWRTRRREALSHHAALAVYGLPLWDFSAARIDVESDVRRVTSRRGLSLHPLAQPSPVTVDAVLVVPVARAIVGTALTMVGTARSWPVMPRSTGVW